MWKNISVNIQNVDYYTSKSALIKMPNKSKYSGYKFWHPIKLVRRGNNSYAITLGYNDNFTFKLKKYGKGNYNSKKIIDEIEINAKQFEEAFECMEDCTRAKSSETYLNITEPKKIEKEIQIKGELKNDKIQ